MGLLKTSKIHSLNNAIIKSSLSLIEREWRRPPSQEHKGMSVVKRHVTQTSRTKQSAVKIRIAINKKSASILVIGVIEKDWINVDCKKMLLGVCFDSKRERWESTPCTTGRVFVVLNYVKQVTVCLCFNYSRSKD